MKVTDERASAFSIACAAWDPYDWPERSQPWPGPTIEPVEPLYGGLPSPEARESPIETIRKSWTTTFPT